MSALNIATAMAAWLLLTTLPPLIYLPSFNVTLISLLFFNNLNIIIALCEIALGRHILYIQSDYKKLLQKYKSKEWSACVSFLFTPQTISSILDSRTWARMWSTYSLYDPSYQNHESFGFFIDVGNGWSTIPPCLLVNYSMIFPERSIPTLVGCVGIAMYWQVMYGTIIYLASFIFNKRYEGKRLAGVMAFVGVSNSLWFFFPILGIWTCVSILKDDGFSVFRE